MSKSKRWRFDTIQGNQGQSGRLSLGLEFDAEAKNLQVHVGRARDIGASPGSENAKGLHVETRLMILHHEDEMYVCDVSTYI